MLSNLQYMYNVNHFSIGLIESAFKINEYILLMQFRIYIQFNLINFVVNLVVVCIGYMYVKCRFKGPNFRGVPILWIKHIEIEICRVFFLLYR